MNSQATENLASAALNTQWYATKTETGDLGPASQRALNYLDTMGAEQLGATRLLEAVYRNFPITAKDGPNAKHTLSMNGRGQLVLGLWFEGKIHDVTFVK